MDGNVLFVAALLHRPSRGRAGLAASLRNLKLWSHCRAYNNTALIWRCSVELPKSFVKGLASLPPFRDKETKRSGDLSKVRLWREQKPGHSAGPSPAGLPWLWGCTALLRLVLFGPVS